LIILHTCPSLNKKFFRGIAFGLSNEVKYSSSSLSREICFDTFFRID